MVPEEIRATMQESVWTSKEVHVALLCYEKPKDFCHRHLFAAWLNRTEGLMALGSAIGSIAATFEEIAKFVKMFKGGGGWPH